MKLSIIIPVYNEKKTIKEIVNKVKKVKLGIDKEIIIVDDYSTDGTREMLNKLNDCKIFYNTKNLGKGATVRQGLNYSSGDVIVIQDADLEYNPEDFKSLIKPILENKSKVVYGSRFLGYNNNHKSYIRFLPHHYIGNKLLSLSTRILYNIKLTDMETCYKMFTREVLNSINLKANGFEFEPEITAKILRKKFKIIELPINYNPRDFKDGKKINWRDGIKAFYYLIKYRFTK